MRQLMTLVLGGRCPMGQTKTSGERRSKMTPELLNRVSGAALILAGLLGIVGALVAIATDTGTPLNRAAGIAAFVAAPGLLSVGFCGMWLHARRIGLSGRLSKAAYVAAALGSVAFAGAALNIFVAGDIEGEPAWIGFLLGLAVFIVGLALGAVIITVSGTLPRWSTLPLVLVVVGIVGSIASQFLPNPIVYPPALAAALTVALGASLILLGSRVWGIEVIINRALVYGVLTASIIGLYVLTVGTFSTMMQGRADRLTFLLATGLVAVVFHPLRQRLQWSVNHLMYGDRDDPYTVLSRLGQRLGGTLAPSTLLATLVETIAQALRLPYAALALRQGDQLAVVASVGAYGGEPLRVPIAYQGKPVAELLLAPRAGERSFSSGDRRLLHDLAQQAGIALHAVQLAVDLQHSRERLVTLREEERRRLRRDLHDGLGPALASIQLNLNAIRHLLEPESPAETIILQTRSDIQAVIADIRRLVYELRPPALDELGLGGAVRQAAAACEQDGLLVTIQEQEGLSSLPAAVEVAAYRIVQEALTNVVRHAHAHRCTVQLSIADGLEVEVIDDGVGIPADRAVGVGLTSMKERAAELGGSCAVEQGPRGGTRVLARLPLSRE